MENNKLHPDLEALRRSAMDTAKTPKEQTKQTALEDYAKIKEVENKIKKTYSQNWPIYNFAKMNEKLLAEKLLLELLDHVPEKPPWMKKAKFSIREKIFIMFLYSYSGYSSRKAVAEIEIARRRGLIEKACHFNSITNMFRDSTLTKTLFSLLEISALPLRQFENSASIDATGFSINFYDRWYDVRFGKKVKKKGWIKLSIIVGNKTKCIISMIASESRAADSNFLVPLVRNASRNFDLGKICADKAYLSQKNLNTIASVGAIPFIPFKSNSQRSGRGSLWKTMFDFFHDHEEEFMRSYHQRSISENIFSVLKRSYRSNLRTKNLTSQINELLVKGLCHNLTILVIQALELGLDFDFRACFEAYIAQKDR